MNDIERIHQLEAALRSLSGCMPNKVYIYGAYGENWCSEEPNTDEFEVVDFEELLGAL